MRVCGIDIKANEIIVCVLSLDRGLFEAPEIRQRRINIANADDPKQLRAFQATVAKLMDDYKVDKIAIKARHQKGKFAGAASGFKLETALQLMETHKAYLISAAVIKETQKYDPLPVDFKDTGLKAFQEQAFMAAYTQLVGPRHPPKVVKDEVEPLSTGNTETNREHEEKPRFVAAKKKSKKTDVYEDKPQAPTSKETIEQESPWAQAKSRTKAEPAKAEPTKAHSNEPQKKPAKENPWLKKD